MQRSMLAWRLCREPFADLNGHGARQYGGRWNSPGRPLVYAASAAALAVLEVRVHLDLPFELLPEDYLLLTINMGDLPVEELANLPLKAAEYGDTWLRERRTPLLRDRAGDAEHSSEPPPPGRSACAGHCAASVRIRSTALVFRLSVAAAWPGMPNLLGQNVPVWGR